VKPAEGGGPLPVRADVLEEGVRGPSALTLDVVIRDATESVVGRPPCSVAVVGVVVRVGLGEANFLEAGARDVDALARGERLRVVGEACWEDEAATSGMLD
jgi:hypothetical protein